MKSRDQLAAEMKAFEERYGAAYDARIRGRYAQIEDWYPRVLSTHFPDPPWDRARCLSAFDGAGMWESLVRDDDGRAPIDAESVMSAEILEYVAQELEAYSGAARGSLLNEIVAVQDDDCEEDGNGKERKADVRCR